MNLRYFGGLEAGYNLIADQHYECAGLIIANGAIMVTVFVPSEVKWVICDIRHFAPATYAGPSPELPKPTVSTEVIENEVIQPKEENK